MRHCSTATPVAGRSRPRGFLRAVLLLPVVMVTSLALVVGTATTAGAVVPLIPIAVSVVGPLLVDAVASGYSPVTEAEKIKYGSATSTTTGTGGVKVQPRPGVGGMILNTVAVLGGLAYFWPGGDDAPALPEAGGQAYSGSGCGWISNTAVVSSVFCNAASFNMALTSKGGYGAVGVWIDTAGTSLYGTPQYTNYCATGCNPGPGGAAVAINGLGRDANLNTRWLIRGASSISALTASSPILAEIHVAKQGSTLADPSTSSDPATVPRYIDSEITCKSASGASQVITHREGPFMFDPSQAVELPSVNDLACPDGTWLSSGKREIATEGSSVKVPLDTGYSAPPWVEQQVQNFPECFPVGSAVCALELWQVPVQVGQPEVSCGSFALGSGNPCRDWATDPNKSERYQCRFGTYAVPLVQCDPLKQRYKVGTVTATDPDVVEIVSPPVGGDPTPEDTPNLGGCVPGWAELLTPWWLFKGVACAMTWAFKPQTALSVRLDEITGTLTGKAPFSWFSGFPAVSVAIPADQCPDWRIKVGGLDKNVVCDSTFTAAIRSSRSVLLVFMGALALWPLIRSTAYAAFPIIKPQPGVLR